MAETHQGDTAAATVDFDHHSPEFLNDRYEHWKKLRRCPVSFSSQHGGFWVVTGHPEVAQVSRDERTFSSEFGVRDGVEYHGIAGVPRIKGIPPAGIAEADPTVHQALRRALNPYLLPQAVNDLIPFVQELADWFLDQKIGSGEIDLVLDYANPVPAIITMRTMGLPCDSWEHYAELFHATVAYRPGSPEYTRAISNVPEMMAGLMAEAESRRRRPRDDMLSALVHLDVSGRRLTDEEVGAVLWNLVGGGLDTTTSLTSLSLHHLASDLRLREQLIDDPSLIPAATEEFLRYFSVNETLTRTVTEDVELGGQRLRRGEVVLISWASANRDEKLFDQADKVIVDRTPNPHLAFGVGPHRCIGMHLARSMFAVLLTTVLDRMPDYRVDESSTRFYEGNPMLVGVVSMPATFTPSSRQGPTERPF
ncbi:MAG TPA: cytochrome P450 [Acidimicrobiales bacterium]|nr:cytochrome P450 [Acidimicrobiales bacterium]